MKISRLGAVLSTIGAGLCCTAPYILISLGLGGSFTVMLTQFGPLQPMFIMATLFFLYLGFVQIYFNDEEKCTIGYQAKYWIGSIILLIIVALPWIV